MDPKHDMPVINTSGSDPRTRRVKGPFSATSQQVPGDQQRAAQEKLVALLIEGLESGEPIEVTPEYWAKKRRRVCELQRSKRST